MIVGRARTWCALAAVFVCTLATIAAVSGAAPDAQALFDRGQTFEMFLKGVSAQRELWIANASRSKASDALVRRLAPSRQGLRFLVVAEDWCPDSVNTVPSVAALARQAQIPLRIVDRSAGGALMDRHRTTDGRTVTPLVVLLRDGVDVGAWIERPALLQKLFRSMGENPADAAAFAARQQWYDADAGRTALSEIVDLADASRLRR
jgi:hypothetical protein